jgi:plastocyanin
MPVRHHPFQFPIPAALPVAALAALTLLAAPGCSEDPPTGPHIDVVIKVRDTTYIPSNVTIQVNQRVEWQNVSRDPRTITSGVGPEDPDAGEILDVTLAGYPPGEAIGGRLQRQFTEPDTFYYFSREVPDGFTGDFLGVIIVEP